jgi:hypothetical protein
MGGLPIDRRRQYLRGGEPTLELPHDGLDVSVDGDSIHNDVAATSISLRELTLDAGEHVIEVGPFRLTFWTIAVDQLPTTRVVFGRAAGGRLVQASAVSESLLCGAAGLPRGHDIGPGVFCPLADELVLLGQPGESASFRPTMAGWALKAGLQQHVVEPRVRSTFPGGDRLVQRPWWVAGEQNGTWWVSQLPDNGRLNPDAWIEPLEWNEALAKIGFHPRMAENSYSTRPTETPAPAALWSTYVASQVQE